MNNIVSRYQIKKNLLKQNEKDFSYTESKMDNLIRRVTCAFADQTYFKELNKKRYHYTEDFANLILTLDELNKQHNINKFLLHCRKCSISYDEMEHFLYLLLNCKNAFSQPFVDRICDVMFVIHLLKDNHKIDYILDDKQIKKNLLFYLVAKQDHSSITIAKDLTLLKLKEELLRNE